jgi:hypothetical protein
MNHKKRLFHSKEEALGKAEINVPEAIGLFKGIRRQRRSMSG